jgi:4'-phosphopantetheinyl transferase
LGGSLPEGTSRPLPYFQLASGQVHVWSMNIANETRPSDRLLASEEISAADRLVDPLKLRFRNARGILRLLLGRYLRLDPASLKFTAGPNGKPFLADGRLGFNVAHTEGMTVIAVGRDCEVGVDVEKLEAPPNSPALAEQFFSAEDVRALSGMTPAMYGRAFLTMWVRKEAVLKAEGTGIGDGLLLPVPRLGSAHGTEIDVGRDDKPRSFYLHDIDVGRYFVGALAVSCKPNRIVEQVIVD